MIEPGTKAPAFHLKDQQGQAHRLSSYLGQWVVLYFYPRDMTPGCTKQACAFRDALPGFEALDAVVFGVSADDEASHQKFVDKHELNFTLLSDPEAKACAKYGVWQEKSMYGKRFMGIVRTTYLIDPKGKVARRWDKVKVPGHIDAVRAELESLHEA